MISIWSFTSAIRAPQTVLGCIVAVRGYYRQLLNSNTFKKSLGRLTTLKVTVHQSDTTCTDEALITITDSLLDQSSKSGKKNKGLPGYPRWQKATIKQLMLERRLAKEAKSAGVDLTLNVFDGMWHVWHVLARIMPEAKNAIEVLGFFIHKHYAYRSRLSS